MNTSSVIKALCSGFLVCLSAVIFAQPLQRFDPADAKVTRHGRSLQPGEVLRLTVISEKPLSGVRANAFEREFFFFESKTGGDWQGLIGIDLDTKPGPYDVTLLLSLAGGGAQTLTEKFTVEPKAFRTRHLTVDEKFVNPPTETLDRIRQESMKLEAIYAGVTPSRLWRQPFIVPVPGPPNSSFGMRSILNDQPRSPHSGTDFEAGAGTPVRAPNSGRIVLTADLYYTGNTVIIDHGQGLYSYFAHLSRFAVKEGAEVRRRQIIGFVGSTGRVTGPHLHWSVRLSGARVDPLSLIAAAKE